MLQMSSASQAKNRPEMDPYFNFIINESVDRLEQLKRIDPDKDFNVFWRGDLAWCLQTYLRLRVQHRNVTCTNRLASDAINIIHGNQLRQTMSGPEHFIVCAQADFPPCRWAHFQIVQNRTQLTGNGAYLPHWPQAGCLPRNSGRSEVKNVAYAGLTYNGNMAGTVEGWSTLLQREGFRFTVLTQETANDLREIDVLLALRSFDRRTYDAKPPSKLFNAWAGRVPLIGGYDSAFQQVGQAGKDYLRAENEQQVMAHLRRLRDDPQFYEDIVRRGAERFAAYTPSSLAEQWWNLLQGPVLDRYRLWLGRPRREQIRRLAILSVARSVSRVKSLLKRTSPS